MSARAWRRGAADERGAALVVTVLVMTTLLVVGAYAIDTAIWFVHGRHLQTQADAAALAAAQDFQCTPGQANATADPQIINTVHQYDGTGLTTPIVSNPYNPQVSLSPMPSPTAVPGQHDLVSLVNSANFVNQSTPNDTPPAGTTWSGSPCTDDAINVKMTETNLPSFFPFVNPSFLNREAQVTIEGLASSGNNLPMAIPSSAPTVVHGTLVDEGNNDAPLGNGRVNLTSSDGVNWSGSDGAVTFDSTIKGPVGLRVDIGGGSTCGTQLQCYDSGSAAGLTYGRVWAAGAIPGSGGKTPAGPEVGDASVSQGSGSACPLTGGVFSNFISSSSSCQASLNTTVYFAAGATCGSKPNVKLSLTVGTQSPAMTCTGATALTTAPCSAANPCVATTWTSADVALGADNPDGPVDFGVQWSQSFGTKPSGAGGGGTGSQSGQCGDGSAKKPPPCTGSFGNIQRAFNGAYDANTANSSRSGPIAGATVTDSSGNELMSRQLDGNAATLSLAVTIINSGAFQDVPGNTVVTPGNPVTLHTGGSQGTYAIQCAGNNGQTGFTQGVAAGCSQPFASTTQSNPPACDTPQTPAVCVTQNPGTGKTIQPGIDCRVNGVITYNADGSYAGCNPTTTCVSPNHWTTPNTVSTILDQRPKDPRLVQVLIVDSNAWVGVSGTSTQTPVRAIATFYITGWSRGGSGGDPCTGATTPTSPGLIPYTSDDDPGNNSDVLLGHFVQYTVPGSGGTPDGHRCTASFGDCIAILTK